MISLDLFGPCFKNKDQLIWQLRTQWIGRELLSLPIDLIIGIGIKVPRSFGSIKKKQALNQIIIPQDNFDIYKGLYFYSGLLENIVVSNRNQFYKATIQKFYCETPKVVIHLAPQLNESHPYSTQGIL